HRRVSLLDIPPLTHPEVAELLKGILGERPDWALVDAVFKRSEGNAFFADELTAARHASALPAALCNVMLLRVSRLSRAAKHLVALGAVAGGAIDEALLSGASGLDPGRIADGITDAVASHVLVVDREHDALRFRHALVREAVYD